MKGLQPLFLGIFGIFAFSWLGMTVVPNLQIGSLNPQTDEDGGDAYPVPLSGMVVRGARVYAANGCFYCHSQQVRPEYGGSDIERHWGDAAALRVTTFLSPSFFSARCASAPISPTSVISRRWRKINLLCHRRVRQRVRLRPQVSPRRHSCSSWGNFAGRRCCQSGSCCLFGTGGHCRASFSPSPAVNTAAPATAPATCDQAAVTVPTSLPAAIANVAGLTASGEPLPNTAAWHHRHLYNPRSLTGDSNMPAYRFLYE